MKAKNKKIKSKGTIVAVEIGVNWFKLAQIETGRKGARITKLHVEPFRELGGSVSVQLSQAVKTLKTSTNNNPNIQYFFIAAILYLWQT